MAVRLTPRPDAGRGARPRNAYRPALEQLEERTTPSGLAGHHHLAAPVFASHAGAIEHRGAPGGLAAPVSTADPALVSLNLNPLDVKLLGLEVQTSQIQVNISAQPGNGNLLGNLLTDVSSLLNVQTVNNALNSVLANVVSLVNSASLVVGGANTGGLLGKAPHAPQTTSVLDLFVAPVHLNLLGALVDTSPIHVTISAHAGPGLILGNVVTDLANLFNPPLPGTFNLTDLNVRLRHLLMQLDAQLPGIAPAPSTTPPFGPHQVLGLSVPPIDLNLLGLLLKTSEIQVNATASTGKGALLGNVLTTLLNTAGATSSSLHELSANLNGLLAKVVGLLNVADLLLSPAAVGALSSLLQQLASPTLVNASGSAMAPILNLAIASADASQPPVDLNLLGVRVTTSNIQAQVLAQTGNGLILGNLLYNVANLLNPGGSLGLLSLLSALGA